MHYGDRLRLCRETKGLKQSDVAKILGVAPNTLSGYESGRHLPSSAMLIKLSELYDVSLDYIIFGTKSTNHAVPELQKLLDGITSLASLDIMYVKALVERLQQK